VNDDPVVLFFTLERLKDGLQISRITTDYP